MESKIQIDYRAPDVSDKSFIFNSWLKSFRNSPFAKPMPNEPYYKNHKQIIEKLLKKSKVLIAANPSDPLQIFGYIVYEELGDVKILHYVYVKYSFRKFGIAKNMVNSITEDKAFLYTHHVDLLRKIKDKYSMLYDPYKALL